MSQNHFEISYGGTRMDWLCYVPNITQKNEAKRDFHHFIGITDVLYFKIRY